MTISYFAPQFIRQLMKKWIAGLLIFIVLTVLSVYIFIPSNINIAGVTASRAPISAAFRYISRQDQWGKWWKDSSGKPHIQGTPYSFDGSTFRLTQAGYNLADIEIEQDGIVIQSKLTLLAISTDSIWALWNGQFPAGNNPFTRLKDFKKRGKSAAT